MYIYIYASEYSLITKETGSLITKTNPIAKKNNFLNAKEMKGMEQSKQKIMELRLSPFYFALNPFFSLYFDHNAYFRNVFCRNLYTFLLYFSYKENSFQASGLEYEYLKLPGWNMSISSFWAGI